MSLLPADKKILCFGEILLRFSPQAAGAWLRSGSVNTYLGGAELNVAQALACWKMPVAYCSAAPDHYLTHEITDHLRSAGVDTSPLLLSGARIGTYYLPEGADLKHRGVIYDRAHSAFSELRPGMIPWERILDNVGWFHCSAITPALSESLAAVCAEGLAVAAKRGIITSMDLNYRPALWKYGKPPVPVMQPLMRYVRVVMGNIWSARDLLGIPFDEILLKGAGKTACLEQAGRTAEALRAAYPECGTAAFTFRFDRPDGLQYFGTLDNGDQYLSKEHRLPQVIDRVGTGDCFMAGLIYGLLNDLGPQRTIDFAASAAVGKCLERGDATKQSVAEVMARMP